MDKYTKMLGKIKSKEEFIRFMELYISTVEDSSVKCYLDSVTAWVQDMDGYYINTGKEMPKNIDWNFIANLFYVGSIYE